MIRLDAGTTNPTLLNRLGDWGDHEAWVDFVTRYDPTIRRACQRFGADADTAEELCQRIWIELAQRMRSFRYDPGKKFRGWLRMLCHSRAIDLLRKKKADAILSLDDQTAMGLFENFDRDHQDEEGETSQRPLLLRLGEEVQDAVRRRVDERTWQLFWNIVVDERPVREIAEASGMTYFAAFAAQKRVGRMLREEGQRLLAERRPHRTDVPLTCD